MSDTEYWELSPEENELIEKHLAFYCSLDSGERSPKTEAQRHFVSVCQGRAKATTAHEQAYVKFRMKLAKTAQLDAHISDVDEFGEGTPRPGWFTDRDWKRMRGRYLSNSDG